MVAGSIARVNLGWQHPFDVDSAYAGEFVHSDRQRYQVAMMVNRERVNVKMWIPFFSFGSAGGRPLNVGVYSIPLRRIGETGPQVELIILAPEGETGLRKLEDVFSHNNLAFAELIAMFDDACGPAREMRVALPRFTIDRNIYCACAFTEMGAPTFFGTVHSREDALAEVAYGGASELIHRAPFAIDEDGVSYRRAPKPRPPIGTPPDIDVDFHTPFIFVVYARELDIPLVVGRVANLAHETLTEHGN